VTLRVCAPYVRARTADNRAKAAGSATFFFDYSFGIDLRARIFAQNRDRTIEEKQSGSSGPHSERVRLARLTRYFFTTSAITLLAGSTITRSWSTIA
jgi:hypothetical protein